MYTATGFKIECDEDGFHLIVETDEEDPMDFRIVDAEDALHGAVKDVIGPWIAERNAAWQDYQRGARAREDYDREAYSLDDPKHADFHSVHADIWDSRAGK
jgi:hypothetical protein